MTDTQEKALIAQILDGSYDEYRYFVDRYHRGLVQHLYRMTYDGDTAEDIAQEAFIKAYEKLSQFNDAYAFSTWLYRIADNIAIRQLQRTRVMQDLDEMQEYLPSDMPSPEEKTEQALNRQAVRRAVRNLPLEYQRVINLYYWDNCSYEDIAVIMDRPVGTVRTWLHRAKEHLRKELDGQI